ncbi:MAG TPA: PIN domain-containing protein [Actinomycetota bacterium]|nr:PIN domain-containing protein [Actinomycetota bacterium]
MTSDGVVLDASALLALLQGEEGADEVETLLDGALMSCVNLSEVIQKAEQHDVATEGLESDLEALGIQFRDFDLQMARPAVERWSKGSGLVRGSSVLGAGAAREPDRGHGRRPLVDGGVRRRTVGAPATDQR